MTSVTLNEYAPNAYSLTKTLKGTKDDGTAMSFNEALEYATAVLKEHGFGVITTVDAREILKKKIDVELSRPYVMLGVCNPKVALSLLQENPSAGLFLPCNVVFTENRDGKTVVSFALAKTVFAGTDSESLKQHAAEIDPKLQACFDALE
jgi:uncharacterized protein (DUF302 family)